MDGRPASNFPNRWPMSLLLAALLSAAGCRGAAEPTLQPTALNCSGDLCDDCLERFAASLKDPDNVCLQFATTGRRVALSREELGPTMTRLENKAIQYGFPGLREYSNVVRKLVLCLAFEGRREQRAASRLQLDKSLDQAETELLRMDLDASARKRWMLIREHCEKDLQRLSAEDASRPQDLTREELEQYERYRERLKGWDRNLEGLGR